jgi:HEAT repeat protein
MPILKKALSSKAPDLHRTAAYVLGEVRWDGRLAMIEEALAHPDPETRANAAKALASTCGEKPRLLLEKALEDPSSSVRSAAARTLRLLVEEESKGPLLARLAAETDESVRQGVADVLRDAFPHDPEVKKALRGVPPAPE